MTAKRKPALAIVRQDDIAPIAGDPLPVPETPILDEDAVYVQGQQAELSGTESALWIIDAEIAAATEDRARQVALINAKYDAIAEGLNSRRATLVRKQARIRAALRDEPSTSDTAAQ